MPETAPMSIEEANAHPHRPRADVRDGGGRDPRRRHPGVEELPRPACGPSSSCREATATRTTSSTRTSGRPSRRTSASRPPSPGRCATASGSSSGDRVAIAMRNLPEWAMAFWGTAAAGGVVVPLNAWWTSPELHYGLHDSGTTVAFVDAARLDRLRAAPRRAPRPAGRGGHPRGPQSAGADLPDVAGPGDLLRRAGRRRPATADVTLPDVTIAPEDDATIFYTSGTTGKPKGAVGTHRNMGTNLMSLFFLNTRAGAARAEPTRPGDGDRRATAAPTCCRCRCSTPPGCHSILVANTAAGQQARHDAPLGPRAGPRAHRARAHHHLRGRPGHGHAGDRLARLRHAATPRRCGRWPTAGPRPRPTSCGGSRSTSPWARPPTATGSPRRRR